MPNNPFDNGDFCFLSPLWKVTFPMGHCIAMGGNFRQGDERFLQLLEHVRNGTLSVDDVSLLKGLGRQLPTSKSLPILHSHIIDVMLSNWKYFQEISVGTKSRLLIVLTLDLFL